MDKSPEAFRTISEVAEWLDTPTHVLRFWESRFKQVKPVKRAGGRRYYRPKDMELLGGIKVLLHSDGLTIRGVQKLLREEGVRHVVSLSPPVDTGDTIEGTAQDAPIELDVQQVPVENVVQMRRRERASPDADTATAASDDTSDAHETPNDQPPEAGKDTQSELFAHRPAKPVSEAETTPDQTVKSAQPSQNAPDSEPGREPDRGPRGDILVGPDQTHPDYQSAPSDSKPAPRPAINADVPDDPPDNDKSVPGIMDVAAALRRAANSEPRHKPNPQVFGELYQRLAHLRHRMDKTSSPKSPD